MDELLHLLEQGQKHRHVGSTAMNAESSRSHSILTLYVNDRICETEERERVCAQESAGACNVFLLCVFVQ